MVTCNDIKIENLQVSFALAEGVIQVVDDVSLDLPNNEITVVIGESGCGKSVLGQAIMGMLPAYGKVQGKIIYKNSNLLEKKPDDFYGKVLGVIPQNPSEALNPIRNIGKQMRDILTSHRINDNDNWLKLNFLKMFGIKDGNRILAMYPFELSGGMQQRVLCAMCAITVPQWILADEPTKGLDEALCSLVYDNLLKFKNEQGKGMLIITHDIELVKKVADRVAVMYSGEILEVGRNILENPLHPYTQALVRALPENGFVSLQGKAPETVVQLTGCKFAPRCKYCQERCFKEWVPLVKVENREVRCFIYA